MNSKNCYFKDSVIDMQNFRLFEKNCFQRLAKVAGWAVVVVGDDEASKNWSVMGVQYLSMEDQTRQGIIKKMDKERN